MRSKGKGREGRPSEGGAPVASRLNRRRVLGFIGTTAAAFFLGDLRGQPFTGRPTITSTQAATATTPRCLVRPQQAGGPYFLDAKLNRSDIRPDLVNDSVTPGVPLRLAFRVSRIDDGSCIPLSGAVVDVWQCDAQGVYSGVRDINGLFDTRGQKFLRGYQTADASGTAQFLTIYPGWYPGRTVHIHFKIRTDPSAPRSFEFTSQLYFDDAITDQVHAQAPYARNGQRRLRNDTDGIFRRGGSQLILPLTKEAQGYAGTFDIGLQTT